MKDNVGISGQFLQLIVFGMRCDNCLDPESLETLSLLRRTGNHSDVEGIASRMGEQSS